MFDLENNVGQGTMPLGVLNAASSGMMSNADHRAAASTDHPNATASTSDILAHYFSLFVINLLALFVTEQ